MAIIDLSFPIRPHFRWKVAPERVATHAKGDPLQSTVVTISCHAYTHVDAPLHFLPDGPDIATMPIDQWIGEAAVVDLSHLGGERRGHGAGAGASRCARSTGRHRAAPDGLATADERGDCTVLAGRTLHRPDRLPVARRPRREGRGLRLPA
jgi:hypothetical protein